MLSIFITGCSKEDDFNPVYNVPPEYQPFIDAFIREATDRGYTLEINNLIIDYDETIKEPHCARCNSSSLEKDVQKIV